MSEMIVDVIADEDGEGAWTGALARKSTLALALVPTTKAMTALGRKAYNSMLHIAHRQLASGHARPDGGFEATVSDIAKEFDGSVGGRGHLLRLLHALVSTPVEWRVLEQAGAARLSGLLGMRGERFDDELRIFAPLSEVRLLRRRDQVHVRWYYPPTVREELLHPERWAQLNLLALGRLETYAAVALYEICARYRDHPAGLTSRHAWQWWVQVLRGAAIDSALRPWRKFKPEFLVPAIERINGHTDIHIELVEHRTGREISHVQFRVRPSDGSSTHPAGGLEAAAADAVVDLSMEELRQIERTDGAADERARPAADLTSSPAAVARTPPRRAQRPAGLRPRALATLPGDDPLSEARLRRNASRPDRPWGGSVHLPPPLGAAGDTTGASLRMLAEKVTQLPSPQLDAWLGAFVDAHGDAASLATPLVRQRLQAREWRSPLIEPRLMRFVAAQLWGPDWLERCKAGVMHELPDELPPPARA